MRSNFSRFLNLLKVKFLLEFLVHLKVFNYFTILYKVFTVHTRLILFLTNYLNLTNYFMSFIEN